MEPLTYDWNTLERLCRQYHVRRLALFGSALTGTDRVDSDLDLLVEFDPQHGPGWDMFLLESELAGVFGRPVDLNTPGFLSRYFRDEVLRSARDLYVQ